MAGLDRDLARRHPRRAETLALDNHREVGVILEVRTYTAHPGKAAQWLQYYEQHGLPVQLKYLGGLVGFFTCEIGTLNRIVHMWKYESLADREARRGAMAKDPAWHDFIRNGPQPSPLMAQESQILIPTAFSPLK
jgi:NIPSNAP